jgi:hypothetical protein
MAKITANRTEETRLVAEAIDTAANAKKASENPKTLFLSAQDDHTDRLIEATISALNDSRLFQVIRAHVTRTLAYSLCLLISSETPPDHLRPGMKKAMDYQTNEPQFANSDQSRQQISVEIMSRPFTREEVYTCR